MSAFRLLAVAILILLCAGVGLAQAGNSAASSAARNEFRISSYPQFDFISQDSREDDSPVVRHPDLRTGLAEHEAFRDLVDSQLPTCYAIRSYRVVRDDPQSDSTHRDGSTTCVAASRFKMYSSDKSNAKLVWGR